MTVDLEALQTEDGLEIAPGVRVRLRSLAETEKTSWRKQK